LPNSWIRGWLQGSPPYRLDASPAADRAPSSEGQTDSSPGHKLVVGDLSQIEARLLAWWAGEQHLLDEFTQGVDVYTEFACDIYQHNRDSITPEQRFVGKTAILGLGYSCGGVRFKEMLGAKRINISKSKAFDIVTMYRRVHHKITSSWDAMNSLLPAMRKGSDMMR